MQRRFKFLIMIALFFILIITVPAVAAYQAEQLPDGNFEVTFTYQSDAEAVYLIGTMNDWKENDPDLEMKKNADGIYELTTILAKGQYEYKFFADGAYKTDPTNPETIGGYNNSLLVLTSTKIEGPMQIGGEIINELYQKGEEGPVALDNSLTFRLEGILKDGDLNKVKYKSQLSAESVVDDIENTDTGFEFFTVDKVKLDNLNITLFGQYFDTSLQANINDNTNSYDYLGLVDASTLNDDRKYGTANPNSFGDNRRIRLEGGMNDMVYNATFTEYTAGIFDDSSNSKYYGLLNFKNDFIDQTGALKGSAGFTGAVYQPVVAGTHKEMARWAALFGEYELAKNLIMRGEYAYVPIGSISERLSGSRELSKGNWEFTFDPRDYDLTAGDISDVHLAGEMNDWDPGNTDYTLVREGDVWKGTFDIEEGTMYKWIVDGEWTPDGMGNDLTVESPTPDDPLKAGHAALAELNYRMFDTARSFRTGSNFYKLENTLGVEIVEDGAYLRLAQNELARHGAGHDGHGKKKVYLNGYYYPLQREDLKLSWDAYYYTPYDDTDTLVDERDGSESYQITPGFDYPAPIEGVEYIKGHFSQGSIPEGRDWDDQARYNDNDVDEFHRLFLEGKTIPIGPINYFLAKINHEHSLEITEVYAETELDIPVEQIAYLKGNIDYKIGDEYDDGSNREARVWVESKFHHIPGLESYFPYFLINYESDQGHIRDHGWYGDDDNDWEDRLYAETKLVFPDIDGLDVILKLESQNIEDEVYPVNPADLDENMDSKYVENGHRIDWYTLLILETGYDFAYEIRGDLLFKYDLSHGELSQYEDDALRIQLSRPLNERTTLKALYNSRHGDHDSEQYISLMLETLF
ncbi:MAG: glycogen-binding domain-containing protein [Halanaerobiales bacterium]